MGFFDSVVKAAKSAGDAANNAAISKTEEAWKKMSSLSTARLEDLIKERTVENQVGFIALMMFYKKDSSSAQRIIQNNKEIVLSKAKSTRKRIELTENREINDLRTVLTDVLNRFN
ncbi:hypothetical protein ACED51_18975 [Photobacterium swingsii]|uniref:hypothetical protein n=1 Tax=Photobacterium swingsii TaxID=680026 RepID=UPI00352CCE18